jgi:nucleotide-binding universal stress UspA family protein
VLDGSPESEIVIDFGIRWAQRLGATLEGLGIVDAPGICQPEPVGIGGGHYKASSASRRLAGARRQVHAMLENFVARCTRNAVSHRTLEIQGFPHAEIARRSEGGDIVLLGQRPRFQRQNRTDDVSTLRRVIRDTSRPVVVVPEQPKAEGTVVVAYDGGPAAARSLRDFVASGLGNRRDVHVVSVGTDRLIAEQNAGQAAEYLRLHDIPPTSHIEVTDMSPAPALLSKAAELRAGLLVAGAFGRSKMREFLFGSTTATLLRGSTIPLFVSH